jgi:type I protein arginine methyltransferase
MHTTKTPLGFGEVNVAVTDQPVGKGELFIWPCVGEYRVYDVVLYYIMTHDVLRNARYAEAVKSLAPGKVALDIGTGAHLNWARACVEAGARKVYAIEEMEESFKAASALAKKLNIEDRLTIIHGSATEVQLPEKVDLCVSEIIGCIGTSEGVMSVLRDAQQRFLKPGGAMIPSRCASRIAAVELPQAFHAAPAFDKKVLRYVQNVFASVGRPFDVRLSIENLPLSSLLSTDDLFEDIDFLSEIPESCSREAHLRVTRPGRLDALLVWIELACMPGQEPIDSLRDKTHWKPVLMPAFYPGIDVSPGDELVMTCEVRPSDDGILPDYRVTGELRQGAKVRPFTYEAAHHSAPFRGDAFYQRLFPE